MYTVYAIWNRERDKLYIGHTENIEIRLKRHNGILPNKVTSFTNRYKGLWKLVYQEHYATRQEAASRERQLKSAQGRKFIKKIIEKQ